MNLSKHGWGSLVFVAMSVACATGCGGGANAKGAQSAESNVSAMDQLQAIPTGLEHDVAELTQPIDEVQAVIDDLTSLPKRHGIAAGDMAKMCKATFDSGTVNVQMSGDISAEARAELEASLKHLANIVSGLKATPNKVATMGKNLVAATAKLPVLATRVTAEASVAAGNPFASADKRAKASADLKAVEQIQASVSKSISDAQAKIVGLPGQATGALAKLGASFASFDDAVPATQTAAN